MSDIEPVAGESSAEETPVYEEEITMTEAEYKEAAEAFRAELAANSELPEDERETPDYWPGVLSDVTCRNGACRVYGQTFRVILNENADGLYRVICGMCSTVPHDVVPLYKDGPGEPLNIGGVS